MAESALEMESVVWPEGSQSVRGSDSRMCRIRRGGLGTHQCGNLGVFIGSWQHRIDVLVHLCVIAFAFDNCTQIIFFQYFLHDCSLAGPPAHEPIFRNQSSIRIPQHSKALSACIRARAFFKPRRRNMPPTATLASPMMWLHKTRWIVNCLPDDFLEGRSPCLGDVNKCVLDGFAWGCGAGLTVGTRNWDFSHIWISQHRRGMDWFTLFDH